MRRFLLNLARIVHDTLDGVHTVLGLGQLTDSPRERLLDGEDVGDGDASLGGGDGSVGVER